jgi:hypothetical protein
MRRIRKKGKGWGCDSVVERFLAFIRPWVRSLAKNKNKNQPANQPTNKT